MISSLLRNGRDKNTYALLRYTHQNHWRFSRRELRICCNPMSTAAVAAAAESSSSTQTSSIPECSRQRKLLAAASFAATVAAASALYLRSGIDEHDRQIPRALRPSCQPTLCESVVTATQKPAADGGAPGSATWRQPQMVPETATAATTSALSESSRPRNVMIHRMRSVRARDMVEKYDINWNVILGEGAYGSVHPARMSATGEKVALKKISKRYTKTPSFKTETDALLRIYDNGGHPNISGLRDMYEDYNHFYLILDLVSGGEMFDHLIQYGAYSEADAARLMRELASALAFIHGVGVIHADLKPENLLLCSKKVADGTIKIIDFGCAVVSHDNYHDEEDHDHYEDMEMRPNAEKKKKSVEASSTGTTAYWPPERFSKGSVGTPAMDMWSTGIILYIMLTGAHPYDLQGMSTDEEIEERIKNKPALPIGPPYTSHLSPSAIDLIQKLTDKDASKRISAYEMMRHPWVRGDTANTFKIAGSDKKLLRFKELRNKLEAGIFAVLVSGSSQGESLNIESERMSKKFSGKPSSENHIMKRAFEAFDAEGKGFVSQDDLGRVLGQLTGQKLSRSDQRDMLAATLHGQEGTAASKAGLSLSVFSDLFSSLKQKHFPKGQVIFNAGDDGDSMYFITSGKVEILTRKGQLVSILRHGEFFGEDSLLEESPKRFAGAKAGTPVDVIQISKEDFERYIKSSAIAKQSLKLKWRARSLANAKNLIRLQTNVKVVDLNKGDVVYREGDDGESMYMVDEEDGGELDVFHSGVKVHVHRGGESFGESSLLFKRPRSSTVVCASDKCKLHKMHADDFVEAIDASPKLANSLRDMCRKRLFKKAVKKFSMDRKRGFSQKDLEAAFYAADKDNSGSLDINEIRNLFHMIDPDFPEQEILALMKFLDIDEDGNLNLDEFKRIFRVFDSEKEIQKLHWEQLVEEGNKAV